MQNLRNKNNACRMKEKSPEGKMYHSLGTVFFGKESIWKDKILQACWRIFSPILRSNMTS